jgi:N-acetylmuramoyl-L-alanine amidase
MPAVLIEASFISRKQEAEALATDRYRQALADGIAAGISRHLEAPR